MDETSRVDDSVLSMMRVSASIFLRVGEHMGEAAEDVLEGLLCQCCGELIDGEEPGYPRYCEDCQEETEVR